MNQREELTSEFGIDLGEGEDIALRSSEYSEHFASGGAYHVTDNYLIIEFWKPDGVFRYDIEDGSVVSFDGKNRASTRVVFPLELGKAFMETMGNAVDELNDGEDEA